MSWDDQKPVTAFYRLVYRAMFSQAGERTLISAISSPRPGHINNIVGLVFRTSAELSTFAGLVSSLPFDFFTKSTGVPRGGGAFLNRLPLLVEDDSKRKYFDCRVLLLNCLTIHYSDLWGECWRGDFRSQRWAKSDPRLDNQRFSSLSPEWLWETPLRTDYERRQAVVEIDVLAARALRLTLDELCTIYRIQFPVLQQNERDTWYDQRGRIVFTSPKVLPGVGFSRPEWEEIKNMTSGAKCRTITDDTLPGGPRKRVIEYVAPFDRCDREADYATAWKFFDEDGL